MRALLRLSRRIETIFLGGGTPSTYPNELLLDLAGVLKDVFDLEFSG